MEKMGKIKMEEIKMRKIKMGKIKMEKIKMVKTIKQNIRGTKQNYGRNETKR